MLVSTFEILVKSQLPNPDQIEPLPNEPLPSAPPDDVLAKIQKLGRTVIQGYFLTIANLNDFKVTVSLAFTALTPSISLDETIGLLDVKETNLVIKGKPDLLDGKVRYTLTVPANDTGLFILQPDFITNPQLLDNKDFEVRGYVEISLSMLVKGKNAARLLLTPEHRGTFFKDLEADDPQLDQIVYSLPTARGGSLFKLSYS
ncbi:MAG: hypothetical protein KME05_17875 [Gloeocapsa sp. UFS-A4-WI-NPMV-4B04]|jgi:hypothetical protein|nr:hypothetical protein [Gloeocapsa sp. UFS-A4-WI-NPMV-4B04]